MPAGRIKSVTRSATAMTCVLETEVANPTPPPPTMTAEIAVPEVPEWAWDIIGASVGKQAILTETGTPPAITAVTVQA